MALSPKMLAVLKKADAANAAYFAALRERTKRESGARPRTWLMRRADGAAGAAKAPTKKKKAKS
jgi:hypothetical protein